MKKLIEFTNKEFPSDFKVNPFSHIIKKCMEYFHADYCSYLAPDYPAEKWQVKTRLRSRQGNHEFIDNAIEPELEKRLSEPAANPGQTPPLPNIKPGMCNLALFLGRVVIAENVKYNPQYSRHYIEQFSEVKHEIVVPLICYFEGDETVTGVIVLDFCQTENFKFAVGKIHEEGSIEKNLGNFVFKRIYKPAARSWEKGLLRLAGLAKIDFDEPAEQHILNDIVFSLWPKPIYYSIWACTSDKALDDPGKKFVRIAYSFSDQETNARYDQETGAIDYIFSENDDSTYGQTLKQFLTNYHCRVENSLIIRKRLADRDHKAISPKFNQYLYGKNTDAIRAFHFIPTVEKVPNNDSGREKVSSIFVFFIEEPGDIRIIRLEQIEWLTQLLNDRIRFGGYKKNIELQKKIQNHSRFIFDDFKAFIRMVGENLLKSIPSQCIDIWMMRDFRIDRYSLSGEKKETPVASEVDEDAAMHILKTCLKDRSARIFNKNDDSGIPDICLKCHVLKNRADIKSCMTVKVIGPNGKIRAILFFFNRKKPLTKAVQAFSALDEEAVRDVAGLLGLILSLYDAREEERKAKTVLPHEFAAPVSILSGKLKDIDETLQQNILHYIPDHRRALKGLLKKKLSDCWYSCDSITYNSENYIKYIKKDIDVTPGPVNLNELMQHLMHLFAKKFKKVKQIYIFMEGVSTYQTLQCHKPMLFSALHNIFDNAFKYSHRYCVFHIKVKEDATHILISFINYGVGIDESELNSVFELYYQSKNIRKYYESAVQRSHGIGLPLAKWYIEECHKGKISFQPSRRIAPFNPFFLHIVKNIYHCQDIYEDTYRNDSAMLNAEPGGDIKAFFKEKAVTDFFRIEKPLGRLGELLFREMLQIPTYENELVLLMPKKFRG